MPAGWDSIWSSERERRAGQEGSQVRLFLWHPPSDSNNILYYTLLKIQYKSKKIRPKMKTKVDNMDNLIHTTNHQSVSLFQENGIFTLSKCVLSFSNKCRLGNELNNGACGDGWEWTQNQLRFWKLMGRHVIYLENDTSHPAGLQSASRRRERQQMYVLIGHTWYPACSPFETVLLSFCCLEDE